MQGTSPISSFRTTMINSGARLMAGMAPEEIRLYLFRGQNGLPGRPEIAHKAL
jgi:hypothetical protein